MDITTRPTTTTAVDADLHARADFRFIAENDHSGRAHYLLGMCEALLAQANQRIGQLEAQLQRMQEAE